MDDKARMCCALALIANNLECGGDWIEALKPVSPQQAERLAAIARAAYFGHPNDDLDEAMRQNTAKPAAPRRE